MPWETEKVERTLIIVKGKKTGEDRFWIYKFHRVQHPTDGTTFMEPNPQNILETAEIFRFNKLEVIDADVVTAPSNTRNGEFQMISQLPQFANARGGVDE